MENLVKKFIQKNKTVSTMESCTGGFVANSITNIEGASEIFKFGAITYSNDYKIKMGVSKDIIEKYSVYSKEVSDEMSYNIATFTNSDYGIGITGKLNRVDKNNLFGENNIVFISIYDKNDNKYYNKSIQVKENSRIKNKEFIMKNIVEMFNNII